MSEAQPTIGQRVRLNSDSGFEGVEAVVDGHYNDKFTVDVSTITTYLDGGQCGLGAHWGAAFEPHEYEIIDSKTGPENGIPAADVAAMGAKPANPKQAYGDKKVGVQYVPPALLIGASKAFSEGAVKYGPFNWRESNVEAMTYVGAILRHLFAYLDGEDVDPESTTGKLHLEGIAACVGILLDCYYGGFLIDNRPAKGPAPEMVRTPKDSK